MESILAFIVFTFPAVFLIAAIALVAFPKNVPTISIVATIVSIIMFSVLSIQLAGIETESQVEIESSVAWIGGADIRWGYRFNTTNIGFLFAPLFSVSLCSLHSLNSRNSTYTASLFLFQFFLISALMSSDIIQFCICSELTLLLVFLLLREPANAGPQSRPLILVQLLASNFILAGFVGLVVLMATFEAGASGNLAVKTFSIRSLTSDIPISTIENGLSEVSWHQVAPFLCFLILGGCMIRSGIFPLHHWWEAVWKTEGDYSIPIFFTSMPVLGFYTWIEIGQPLFETEFDLLSNLILWLGAIGYFWSALIGSSGTIFRKLAFIGIGNTAIAWAGLATQNQIADNGVVILIVSQVILLSVIFGFQLQRLKDDLACWLFLIGLLPGKITILYGMMLSNPTTTTATCLLIVLAESLLFWLNFCEIQKRKPLLESND